MEVRRVRKMKDSNWDGMEARSAGRFPWEFQATTNPKVRSAGSFPWEFQATANPKARGDNDGDSRGPVVILKE